MNNESDTKPNTRNQSSGKYKYLSVQTTVNLRHQEARRFIQTGEVDRVLGAYYRLENVRMATAGIEQTAELIEMYRARGQNLIEELTKQRDRLESEIENKAVLGQLFEKEMSVDEGIQQLIPLDGELSEYTYSRSAGGQKQYTEALEMFDQVCCLIEILSLSGEMEPAERFKTLADERGNVAQLGKHVRNQDQKADKLARKKLEEKTDKSTDSENQKSEGTTSLDKSAADDGTKESAADPEVEVEINDVSSAGETEKVAGDDSSSDAATVEVSEVAEKNK